MPGKLHIKPENILLVTTTLLAFLFFLWGVDSWKFAFTGDDWPFYIFALKLLHSPIPPSPFSFTGVYYTHSQLASMYQMFFMLFLGPTNFAWRISNIVLIVPLSYFFYRFVKITFDKDVALLATILMQCSFYLANFFKIGYDNPQGLTLFVISLYLAARFGKKPTKTIGFLLGGTLGISFYAYFGAAFPLFIWPFLLPLRKKLRESTVIRATLGLFGTYLLFLCLLLPQITTLTKVLHELGSPGSFHIKSTILYDFILFYNNHDYFYNHFVTGPYLDYITQIFCLIGTILVVLRIKKKPYTYLLLSYIVIVFFLGSTSSDSSPVTRGIFLLPYGFVFAGLGLNLIRKTIKNTIVSFSLCWIVLLAVATINVYQSQIGVFTDKNAGYTGTALIIKSLQEDKTIKKPIILVLSSNLTINTYTWMLPYMREAYGLSDIPFSIVRPNNLTCMKNAKVLVFKKDTDSRKKIKALQCNHQQTNVLVPTILFY